MKPTESWVRTRAGRSTTPNSGSPTLKVRPSALPPVTPLTTPGKHTHTHEECCLLCTCYVPVTHYTHLSRSTKILTGVLTFPLPTVGRTNVTGSSSIRLAHRRCQQSSGRSTGGGTCASSVTASLPCCSASASTSSYSGKNKTFLLFIHAEKPSLWFNQKCFRHFRKLEEVQNNFMDEKDRVITEIYNESKERARWEWLPPNSSRGSPNGVKWFCMCPLCCQPGPMALRSRWNSSGRSIRSSWRSTKSAATEQRSRRISSRAAAQRSFRCQQEARVTLLHEMECLKFALIRRDERFVFFTNPVLMGWCDLG